MTPAVMPLKTVKLGQELAESMCLTFVIWTKKEKGAKFLDTVFLIKPAIVWAFTSAGFLMERADHVQHNEYQMQ